MTENTHKIIYYTGGSERRILALEQISEIDEVINFAGGPEEDIADVISIMWAKMAYAYPHVLEDAGGYLNNHIVIAVDARISILVKNNVGALILDSKGKPEDDEAVYRNFLQMSLISNEVGYGHYQLISASGGLTKEGHTNDVDICRVDLSKIGIDYLATCRGYDEYVSVFKEFYISSAYVGNNLSAISPSKISGGISLPVLRSMGLVKFVNGVEQARSSREAFEAFRLGLLTVAVGFGPNVLKKIHPDALEKLLEWEWLNQVATKVTN